MSHAARLCVATALLLTGSGTGFAIPPTSSLPPANASPATVATAPEDQERALYAIPSRLDRAGRIIAPVMIDGRGPFRFMLDTGSNHTVIAESALAKLGLTADLANPLSVTGIIGSESAPTVEVAQFDSGDLHFHDVRMPVLSGPVLHGLDGILGMDGFDGLKLTADFAHDRLEISESHNRRASYADTVIPIEFLSQRLLMADARVARVHVKAIFDTGSPRTIGNLALLQALNSGHGAYRAARDTQVTDATQATQQGLVSPVSSVTVGPMTIQDLRIAFGPFSIFKTWGVDDEPAMLIGMDVLGNLSRLSIDYQRREVDLQMSDAPPKLQQHWFSFTNW